MLQMTCCLVPQKVCLFNCWYDSKPKYFILIDKTVKIWDLNNGKEIQTLAGHPNSVVAIKYDEYAQLVYSVTSSYVRVWDMRLSKCIKTLR